MSSSKKQIHNSIRLTDYDYSQEGAYFITLVTYQRNNIFGNIINGVIEFTPFGIIASEQWIALEKRFHECDFSTFVIMPNHVHGIVYIIMEAGQETLIEANQASPNQSNSAQQQNKLQLGTIVRAYKASVSFRVNAIRGKRNPPVWQPNYYERIIRDEKEFDNIWKYIYANPDRWEEDQLHL